MRYVSIHAKLHTDHRLRFHEDDVMLNLISISYIANFVLL